MELYKYSLVVISTVVFSALSYAQVDTLKTSPVDSSMAEEVVDTLPPAVVHDTITEVSAQKEHKKYDRFKIGAGISRGAVDVVQTYSSEQRFGYVFSFAYQRGRFFYWEAGVEWNSARIELLQETNGVQDEFSVGAVEVPLSVGINLLSPIDRIIGLRAFVGATPSFVTNVGENDLGIGKSDTNIFNAYAHAGIGVNVIFLYIDAVYKYGLTDFFEEFSSQPRQFQVKLGFRF